MIDKLVTIDEFSNVYEADMAKMYIENEGMYVFLADFNIVAFDWFLSNAVGNIKLQVRTADVERAMALLAKARPTFGMGKPLDANESDDLTCLACGTAMLEDQVKCGECGWGYEGDGEGDGGAG